MQENQLCGAVNNYLDVPTPSQPPSCLQQLQDRQARLMKELGEVQTAIEVLAKNPEIEQVLTVLGRVARY